MPERQQRPPLGERLITALEQVIEHARGERELKTYFVPYAALQDYTGEQVAQIRKRLKLSQSTMARCLRVSLRTLQSWEQGLRKPSRPAMRLIQIFDQPRAFAELLDQLPSEEKTKYKRVPSPAPVAREHKKR